ncbi:MAG: STAS domain-containing protein, partial [Candidatus Krumholzibacteria bacterium]|nr:STAS domain-containing protein [Candidatus Krumholzibacteria bacterium]
NEQEIRAVRILHLQGEISAVAMVDLDNLLQKHQENHVRRLILDFNDVGDINYRGVGLLSERAFRMRGAGGEVKVAGLHGSVADAFQFVGADRLIEIYESPQEALASFGIQAGA